MDIIINAIYNFLASPATTPLIAILAASGALLIYYIQKHDNKKDAANIILLEIQNAETNLLEAKKSYEAAKALNVDSIVFPEKLRLMKTESWTKYKYLFVRDFESSQWQEIGRFYDNCAHFDEAVEHKDSTFTLNEDQIRANLQLNISRYAKELADEITPNPNNDLNIEKNNKKLTDEYMARKDAAVKLNISNLAYIYNPDKSFQDAAYYFNLLPASLTNAQTGHTLKKLAGITKLRLFHRQ